MYENSPLYAIVQNSDKTIQVRHVCQDQKTQRIISKSFSDAQERLMKDKQSVDFDGKYVPQSDDMEILAIEKFELPIEIQNAIINPQGLELYSIEDGELPVIKSLFVGECLEINGHKQFNVSFQKFRNDQYINSEKHHLFLSNDTFIKENRLGITICPVVDCVYLEGKLFFESYHFARQIFDLSDYYREAMASDIRDFLRCDLIFMDNAEDFVQQANSWERRKIASINDSGILKNYTAEKISLLGEQSGLQIFVSNKKIILPTDRTERKQILGFLDEEVFKGVFSQNIYQTNSKRRVK